MSSRLYNWFLYPHRLAAIRPHLSGARPKVLDVGCGNHSPRITKTYWPACEYHGIDNRRWNRDAADERCMDRLFALDLEQPAALDQVPDGVYDAVICSHVLEHLSAPLAVVRQLAQKVKPRGVLYVEVPSKRSLRLPSAAQGWLGVRGCLNFRDDETHKALVDLDDVCAVLQACGFSIRRRGPRRLWRRVLGLPLFIGAVLIVKRFIPASVLWDVCGFAEAVTAVRNSSQNL